MLRWRLLLGLSLVALLLALCWLDAQAKPAGMLLAPISLGVAALAVGEMLWLFRGAGISVRPWLAYAGTLAIVAAPWTPLVYRLLPLPMLPLLPALALVCCILLALVVEIVAYRRPGGVTQRLAAETFIFVYVGLLWSFAPLLRMRGDRLGLGELLSMIIVVKLGDTGAYTVGRLIGRHKMAPLLSPGKTWEGIVGSLLFSCAGSWFALEKMYPWLEEGLIRVTGYEWIWYGLIVGTAGILGDLAESLLKRDLGQKDSSSWLPGFGGVLDIIDSLLFAAPVAYLCWMSGLTGYYTIE